MSSGDLSRQLRKPKTHRGRKFLQQREPRVYENDKQTLLIRGAHTSQIVHDFLTDLVNLFRGPKVSRINSSGIEHVMHFIMPSDKKLLLRVSGVKLRPVSKGSEKDESSPLTEAFRAPWGPYVQVELQNSAPEVDFVLRRRLMPSEEKWKRACRVPAELRPKKEKFKNRSMDVFGSKVAQVHVHREQGLENLRPGASMRTALTGSVKRGFERRDPSADKPAAGVKSGKKRKPEKAGATPSGPKRPRTS
ncbi:rRNA-binding ribosome biosynthesis protein rpf2 [Sparganum proliferum]